MTAKSPTAFYLLEILKVAWAVAPIALILAATFLGHPQRARRPIVWLRVITAVWLVVMLLARVALSSPVSHHYMSGTFDSGEAAQRQMNAYFAITSLLWFGEQIMFALFSVVLVFVLRAAWRAASP